MQFNILTIFIVLLCSFSIVTTFFSYYYNYQGMLTLSSTLTSQANRSVANIIDSVTDQAELLAQTTRGVLTSGQDVTKDNALLINYLFNALQQEPNIDQITIANRDGNLLSVNELALSGRNSYFFNPEKSFSFGIQYALRAVTRTGSSPEDLWEYKNSHLQTIETERIPVALYDPRSEDWYATVAQWPRVHWASIYSSNEPAKVSVSVPVVNYDRDVFAVIRVDLSLQQLSNILALQKIGKEGKAFVMTTTGEILVPEKNPDDEENSTSFLAQEMYRRYAQTKEHVFFLKHENTKYIADITELPLDVGTKWLVGVVVPFNDFFGAILQTQYKTILISFIILILFGILVYLASKYISAPIASLADAVDRIQDFDFQEPAPIKSRISEIISLDSSLKSMRNALRSFTRYVPREIVKTLIKQKQEIEIGGERRDLTVLFSDIENFTTIAESFPIEKLTSALSEYFEALSEIIVQSEGTIDKYIGDSIMAFWNAPNLVVDQGDKACLVALRCLKILNHPEQNNVLLRGRTRFGIHSGEAIVGNIGTSERMNYTAIGNVVNTASRLQSLNKTYHTSIIISETVHEKIGTRFVTRPLDFIVVKGRTKGITIFELMGVKEGEPDLLATPEQAALCAHFTEAYELFHAGKIEDAKKQFISLRDKYPADAVTQIYLDRLK